MSRVTTTTVPPTGWGLLKIPPMKQAADPNPSAEMSPMRIVRSSSRGIGTNELTDVSVIEASGHVWSCPLTHGCVPNTSNVVQERQSANCRVETGAACSRVIIQERLITNGGILSASDISKERGIANGVVTESGRVGVERKGADSVVE